MTSHIHIRRLAIVSAVAVLACTQEQAPKVPLSQLASADSARAQVEAHAVIGPAAKAALDSGNAFYRQKDYMAALTKYRAASELAPQHAAPFFGMYMVARATGNMAMADSALADIRKRNGTLAPVPHSANDSVVQRAHEVAGLKPSRI